MRALVLALAVLAGCQGNRGIAPEGGPGAAGSGTGSTSGGLGSSASTSISTSTSPSTSTSTKVKVVRADEESEIGGLVRTARLQAKSESRVLVVYVSASWCEPCKKFKAEIESGRLDARLGKVTFLAFDADRDADRLGALGYHFRYIPFVALPGADGHPADSQEARGKGGQAWQELLAKLEAWQAPGP